MLDVIRDTKLLNLDNPQTLAVAGLLLELYTACGEINKCLALQLRVPGVERQNRMQDGLFSALYRPTMDKRESQPGLIIY